MCLAELTVSYNTSFDNATERKRHNQKDLSEEIKRIHGHLVLTIMLHYSFVIKKFSFHRVR